MTLRHLELLLSRLSRKDVVDAVGAKCDVENDEIDEFVCFGLLKLFQLGIIRGRQFGSTLLSDEFPLFRSAGSASAGWGSHIKFLPL